MAAMADKHTTRQIHGHTFFGTSASHTLTAVICCTASLFNTANAVNCRWISIRVLAATGHAHQWWARPGKAAPQAQLSFRAKRR
jgi:hypothetical protein